MLIKLPNYEGLQTKDISPSNNTAELEKLPASHTGDKLEMEEEETDMQLPKSEIESVFQNFSNFFILVFCEFHLVPKSN